MSWHDKSDHGFSHRMGLDAEQNREGPPKACLDITENGDVVWDMASAPDVGGLVVVEADSLDEAKARVHLDMTEGHKPPSVKLAHLDEAPTLEAKAKTLDDGRLAERNAWARLEEVIRAPETVEEMLEKMREVDRKIALAHFDERVMRHIPLVYYQDSVGSSLADTGATGIAWVDRNGFNVGEWEPDVDEPIKPGTRVSTPDGLARVLPSEHGKLRVVMEAVPFKIHEYAPEDVSPFEPENPYNQPCPKASDGFHVHIQANACFFCDIPIPSRSQRSPSKSVAIPDAQLGKPLGKPSFSDDRFLEFERVQFGWPKKRKLFRIQREDCEPEERKQVP